MATTMTDSLPDRILVHAVVSSDGDVGGISVVTRFADGSFRIEPYTGEASGIRFTNSIAVIAPFSVCHELEMTAKSVSSVPALIAAVRSCMITVAATAGDRLLILSPSR